MNKDQKLKDWFKAGIDDYGTSTDNVDKASLEIQIKPNSNGEYSVIINGINCPQGNEEGGVITIGDFMDVLNRFF